MHTLSNGNMNLFAEKMKANQAFLDEALNGVESESIKKWATTPHNKRIMLQVAEQMRMANEPAVKLTIFVVSNAMGIW